MRVPKFALRILRRRLDALRHAVPDEIIGRNARSRKRDGYREQVDRPFLIRWFVIPKNKWLNIYLHQFVRDDEDRALHDHPWHNLSIIIAGQYIEHTIKAGGIHMRQLFSAGDMKYRLARTAHRIELCRVMTGDIDPQTQLINSDDPWFEIGASGKRTSWSLFITGPVVHVWGFHCPETGWRSSAQFNEMKGCD